MKRSKQYQKGKHIYIKSGKMKEVHTIKQGPKTETEFAQDYQEIYSDAFQFKTSKEGIKIIFGKQLFGTNQIKLKRTIQLGYKNAKRFESILKQALHS